MTGTSWTALQQSWLYLYISTVCKSFPCFDQGRADQSPCRLSTLSGPLSDLRSWLWNYTESAHSDVAWSEICAPSWFFTVWSLQSHRDSSQLFHWPCKTHHHVAVMLILPCTSVKHSAIPCEYCPSFLLFNWLFCPVSSIISALSRASSFPPKLPSLPLKTCGAVYFRRGLGPWVWNKVMQNNCSLLNPFQTCYSYVFPSDCFCSFGKAKDMSSTSAPSCYFFFLLLLFFALLAGALKDWKCLFGLTKLLWQMFSNCERIWPL